MKICVVTNRVGNAKRSFSLVSQLLKGTQNAKVTVFHFTRYGKNTLSSIKAAAREILTDETLKKNVTFERLESMQPSFLVRLTDKDRPDFLVVNRRDFTHGLLGKTWKISQLIHSISVPTFVVARKVKSLSHFLVGLIKSESDQEIRVVTELAHPLNAKVSLLYVIPESPGMYYGLTKMQETASTFLKSHTTPSMMVKQDLEYLIKNKVEGTLLLRHGEDMVEELIAERTEGKYDLIVLSSHHESLLSRLLEGPDIPIDLMKKMRGPLLIIPDVKG